MTSKEALEKISNHKCYVKESSCYDRVKELYKNEIEKIEEDLERKEQLETFITWLRGQTFRKTDEIDKIFKKLKEVLE